MSAGHPCACHTFRTYRPFTGTSTSADGGVKSHSRLEKKKGRPLISFGACASRRGLPPPSPRPDSGRRCVVLRCCSPKSLLWGNHSPCLLKPPGSTERVLRADERVPLIQGRLPAAGSHFSEAQGSRGSQGQRRWEARSSAPGRAGSAGVRERTRLPSDSREDGREVPECVTLFPAVGGKATETPSV